MFGSATSKHISRSATRVESQPLLPRMWHGFKYFVMLPALIVVMVSFYFYLQHHQLFFVRVVKVLDPGLHINKQQLKQIVEPIVNQGFLRFDVQSLQSQLQSLPWVASVAVEREWPDTLIIRVQEYKPIATWAQHNLLASNGDVFSPGTVKIDTTHLPLFTGPDADAKEILQTYQHMQTALQPLHLQIKEVRVSNRHAWELVLDNGMTLRLGGKQPMARLKEFVKVYPTVFAPTPASAAHVDMRYEHGMAVEWNKDKTHG